MTNVSFIAFSIAFYTLFLPINLSANGRGEQQTQKNSKTNNSRFENELSDYFKEELKSYSYWEIVEIQPNGRNESLERFSIDRNRKCVVTGTFAYVPVIMSGPSGLVRTIMTIRLKLSKTALVAIRDIQVNTELQKTDFEIKDVDATVPRGILIANPADLSHYRAKMYIKSGACLTDQMVRQRALIKHGDPVNCYLVRGGVTVSLDCISRDDGLLGDIIHVVTKDKKLYRAKVESAETARIME